MNRQTVDRQPGAVLGLLLASRGIGVTELARSIGIEQASVSNWISGRTRTPRLDHLHRAEDALELDRGDLATMWGYNAPDTIAERVETLERDMAGLKAQVAELRSEDRQRRARKRPNRRTNRATPDAG